MVMWFQGLRQRNQPREPARPRGQSNNVRPCDRDLVANSRNSQDTYIFGSRLDTVVF